MAHTNNVITALFNDDDILMKSIKPLREKGYKIREVYTPFPVHGLDHALGLDRTRMAITAFIYGLIGLSVAISLTYYIMIIDWPQNIGGKPSMTWWENMPAFVPILFEMTVFFAAHLLVWTYFVRNGMYPGRAAMNPDPRTTDDMFMMEIEYSGDDEELRQLLKDNGAVEINVVANDEDHAVNEASEAH
ncbi:MAG: DUF3341 domain-containing protein [Flavobacteriales bacterium]|jgi:hypothetical protein|nr:MAG: DUF3341 domain-containing protein [Flavobacteriales bacterium]